MLKVSSLVLVYNNILIVSTGKSRIHLNVERWRVCEAWFSPTMAGVDSAGVGEVLQNILARFSDAEKGQLVKVCPHCIPQAAIIVCR